MQHLLFFFHYNTLIYWISSNLTTPLTTINKGVLENTTNFTIEIKTINHFLNTLIYWISSNLTTPLTTINKCVLVNATNFTIEIKTINHFFNNRAQTLYD